MISKDGFRTLRPLANQPEDWQRPFAINQAVHQLVDFAVMKDQPQVAESSQWDQHTRRIALQFIRNQSFHCHSDGTIDPSIAQWFAPVSFLGGKKWIFVAIVNW